MQKILYILETLLQQEIAVTQLSNTHLITDTILIFIT